MQLPDSITKDALALAKLILKFGRTNRITYHEDGTTFESDTDHTVMLGIMGCAYAARYAPHLDLGKIAQFSLVHDLVEVHAGDTPAFHIMSVDESKSKEEREKEALTRIKEEFGTSFPWIIETIDAYERLDTPEARFVKVFDKTLPKLTHVLNNGATLRDLKHTKETAHEFRIHQVEKIAASYGADQPEAMAFLEKSNEAMDLIKYN